MKTTLYLKWINHGESAADDILLDPYKLFGYLYANSVEGRGTLEVLKPVYRSYGLYGKTKGVPLMNQAIDWLMKEGLMVVGQTISDMNPLIITAFKTTSVETRREYQKKRDALNEKLAEKAETSGGTPISTRHPIRMVDEIFDYWGQFRTIDSAIVEHEAFTGGNLLALRLFIYLYISSAFKQSDVWVKTSKGTMMTRLYKGDALSSFATLTKKLKASKRSISAALSHLENHGLIKRRATKSGTPNIHRVMYQAPKSKEKAE